MQGVLKFAKKRSNAAKRAADLAKNRRDNVRLQHIAPPDVMDAAVEKALIELCIIHANYGNKKRMPRKVRSRANIIMAGTV
jgi:hypothetical protein